MASLEADYNRFRRLHSWYKHIPLEGRDFFVSLRSVESEQARNGGMHWHFNYSCHEEDAHDDSRSFVVRFGPFLRGIECYTYDENEPVFNGFNIIVDDAGEAFAPWIAANYPQFAHIDWASRHAQWTETKAIAEIYETECARYKKDMMHAYAAFTNDLRLA